MTSSAHPGSERSPEPASLAGMAVYTMFSGDPRQVVEWCNYHLNVEADHIYVALDRPRPELLAALPRHERLTWLPLDQSTWDRFYPATSQNVERKQVDGFRWVAEMATRAGHSHLAFVDSDELIFLREPFTEIWGRTPDVLAFRLEAREMWRDGSEPLDDPFAARLAIGQDDDARPDWKRVLGARSTMASRGFLGHRIGKSVSRLPLAAGDYTVHGPAGGRDAPGVVVVPHAGGGILHYDSGSFLTWNAKWHARLAGVTAATGLGPRRRAQERLFQRALRRPPAEQAEFYRDFYSLSAEACAHLEEFGLIERIDNQPYVDGPLPVPANEDPMTSAGRLQDEPRTDFQFAHVCDARFVNPTFATMLSVITQLDGKGSIRFVVLGDGLEERHVDHLMSLDGIHGRKVEVRVEDITSNLDRDVGKGDSKRATFGRIYLIDHLPRQRTIYLDGDILATRDFSELFELDLEGACLAGAPDSAALRLANDPSSVPLEQRNRLMGITKGDPLQYLNGGLLIFDLDNPDFAELALRARSLVVDWGPALKQRDQDALNIAFAGRKYHLDSRYNYMTQFYTSDRCIGGDMMRRKYDAADAAIIHFSGKVKPWEESEPEFYNGLYRKLVNEAEDAVGTTCGFYFSRSRTDRPADWSREEWVAALTTAHVKPAAGTVEAGVDLVDICDHSVYLRVAPTMLDLAHANDLRVVATAGDGTLLEVPLDPAHASTTKVDGMDGMDGTVLAFPIDLPAALAETGLVATDVEFALAAPETDGPGFRRTLKSVSILRASASEAPRQLMATGTIGAVDALDHAALWGWVRSPVAGQVEPLHLYLDGRLVACVTPDRVRKSLPADGRHFAFKFDLRRIPDIGKNTPVELDVRVPGTNISLRQCPVLAKGIDDELSYDKPSRTWVSRV